MTDTPLVVDQRRERLVQICTALPEVTVSGEQHLTFQVRTKTFAYYLHNHHNDGRIALCCKAYPGDLQALIAFDPLRVYAPAYLGSKGWVGVRLDQLEVDWAQVTQRVTIAYRLVAPKRLAEQIVS